MAVDLDGWINMVILTFCAFGISLANTGWTKSQRLLNWYRQISGEDYMDDEGVQRPEGLNGVIGLMGLSVGWIVAYTLMGPAIYMYGSTATSGTPTYDAVWALWLTNLILVKLWEPALYSGEALGIGFWGPTLAFIDSLLIFGSALFVLCEMGMAAAWTAFWIYLFYVLWVTYIAVMSGIIMWNQWYSDLDNKSP